MAFQRVAMKKEPVAKNLREQLEAMASYEPENSMSGRRFLGSILSLFSGLAIVYASIFYVPAYYNVGEALGLSTEEGKLPAIETENRHALSTYTDMFQLRRGYIRQGEGFEIKYVLTPGTKMVLNIQRCSAPIVIEAFYCMNTQGREIVIENKIRGTKVLRMAESGFYYFDESVTSLDGSPTTKPFTVIWKRTT